MYVLHNYFLNYLGFKCMFLTLKFTKLRNPDSYINDETIVLSHIKKLKYTKRTTSFEEAKIPQLSCTYHHCLRGSHFHSSHTDKKAPKRNTQNC